MNARLYEEDLTQEELSYLLELWDISKVLSHKRYDRLKYVLDKFLEEYPLPYYKNHNGSIYKIIDKITL